MKQDLEIGFKNRIPISIETDRLLMVTPPPKDSDNFIRELLSDSDGATMYLPFFYKGPKGWTK